MILERGSFVFPLGDHDAVVDAAARGRGSSPIKTKLEKENDQLREQLRFQVRLVYVSVWRKGLMKTTSSKVIHPTQARWRCAPASS